MKKTNKKNPGFDYLNINGLCVRTTIIFFLKASLVFFLACTRIAGQRDLSFDAKDLSHFCFICLCIVTDKGG